MYRKIEDFQRDWKYEAESTAKMLKNFTDESLSHKVTENGRTLGFLAWHLVTTLGEMPGQAGVTVDAPAHDSATPDSAAEIIAAYEKSASLLGAAFESAWTDEMLPDEIEMYSEKWTRGLTLLYLILHQAHHRGQITVLMRQAGLKVPGVYGPAAEEWAAIGMTAMA